MKRNINTHCSFLYSFHGVGSLALFFLVACSSSSEKQANTVETPIKDSTVTEETIDTMQVDAVTSATAITNPSSFNGTLVIPPHSFATVSLTMGGIIKSTSLLPGAYVGKGTILATLENPEFIDLQQSYMDSHAQLEYLEAEYKRQQILSKEEVASQKKYQLSKADYLSMKSKVQAASAQLSLLGVSAEKLLATGIRPYLEIKAPVNGYVSNVQVNLGKHLSAGEPLCDVIDKSKTMIRLIAYEKDLKGMKIGNPVQFRVNGLGRKTFHATLVSIGQQVDNTSRSLEIYAKVNDGDEAFRPGMYVTARMAK
ncbi:MAG: efflux RND transporter periplasmic adaptor subunit [Bacteroidaceae bacterium]